jgi:hypothetical protein
MKKITFTITNDNGIEIKAEGNLFTKQDLFDFGNYLLSDKRNDIVAHNNLFNEKDLFTALQYVHDEDFESWIDLKN